MLKYDLTVPTYIELSSSICGDVFLDHMMLLVKRPVRYVVATAVFISLLYFNLPGLRRRHPRAWRPIRETPLEFVKSSFDWATLPQTHPVAEFAELPTNKPAHIPRIQHKFGRPSKAEVKQNEHRRGLVRDAFEVSWYNYRRYAWGFDELKPVSGSARNSFSGWAATLVDSLDTLWIMELYDDFYEAGEAAARIDWSNTTTTSCSVFETTIRYLGGLLSAYDLSQEPALLHKATELGDMLYAAFDTKARFPGIWLNFDQVLSGNAYMDSHTAIVSIGSLSLEFTRLTQLTGDPKYYDATLRITQFFERGQMNTTLPGMWPVQVNLASMDFSFGWAYTLGAEADSMYEYLPKMYLLLTGRDDSYRNMFHTTAKVIEENLFFRPMIPGKEDILISGDASVYGNKTTLATNSQHLTCFVGGMFGLASRIFDNAHYLDLGEKLTRGCIYAYDAFPTGVMPEIFGMMNCNSTSGPCDWDEESWSAYANAEDDLPPGFIHARDPRYLLRPEAIESVFILYRITGKQEYRDAAWRMFKSVQLATATEFGNSAIVSVMTTGETKKLDNMESFWLAETLKYFYLIFSPPDVISLDEYVFNTEAHPFKL